MQEHVNMGSISKQEMEKQLAQFELADMITNRIDTLLAAAPELFDNDHAFGRRYNGDIQIAIRTIVGCDESVTKFYAIEDDGIAFTAEKKSEGEISSIFIATGSWPDKFEKIENSVREARS